MERLMMNSTATPRRRGSATTGLVIGAVVATIALGGAAWMLSGVEASSEALGPADIHTVQPGEFEVTIPASGNLVAQNQVEIRNRLDGSAVITEIVPEGAAVVAGDVLLRLDDQDVKERIIDAEESLIQSQADVEAWCKRILIRVSSWCIRLNGLTFSLS